MPATKGEAPIADLTFADIETLIAEEAEEGPRLELERGLPANDSQGEAWMSGARRFSNPARDGLAKEIVALANAYGRFIVVGIDETEDHAKRACGPKPFLIPRVAACAEQMQQALDSLIDPPLAVQEIRGIEKPEADSHGVLVLRTGSSTRARHGHSGQPADGIGRKKLDQPIGSPIRRPGSRKEGLRQGREPFSGPVPETPSEGPEHARRGQVGVLFGRVPGRDRLRRP